MSFPSITDIPSANKVVRPLIAVDKSISVPTDTNLGPLTLSIEHSHDRVDTPAAKFSIYFMSNKHGFVNRIGTGSNFRSYEWPGDKKKKSQFIFIR